MSVGTGVAVGVGPGVAMSAGTGVAVGNGTGITAPGAGLASPAGEPCAVPIRPQEVGLDHDLKERERELILATLRVTGGSRKLTAERLGISPRTLRHKLQQLKAAGVNVPRVHDQQFVAV
jgi:DNA-binding NtrC family response regulator